MLSRCGNVKSTEDFRYISGANTLDRSQVQLTTPRVPTGTCTLGSKAFHISSTVIYVHLHRFLFKSASFSKITASLSCPQYRSDDQHNIVVWQSPCAHIDVISFYRRTSHRASIWLLTTISRVNSWHHDYNNRRSDAPKPETDEVRILSIT